LRVLITGASSGIGAATARRLAARGDELVLVARGREGLERIARETGAQVEIADVTDRDALEAAFERAGELDAVVANAGAAAYGRFAATDPEDVDRTIAVTLLGTANTLRCALPRLERTRGTLVVTGSIAGRQPMPLAAAYSASKHGVRGLLESVRLELREAGSPVRVAMVHPGPVDTPFWVNVTPAEGRMPPKMPSWVADDPDRIARALVNALDRPRPERIVGWTMRAAGLIPRPLRDLVLVRIVRLALEKAAHAEPGRAIWEPAGTGQVEVLSARRGA
jgi:NADP-dependent 3-hydroxy acid dehydrogenase YdfG